MKVDGAVGVSKAESSYKCMNLNFLPLIEDFRLIYFKKIRKEKSAINMSHDAINEEGGSSGPSFPTQSNGRERTLDDQHRAWCVLLQAAMKGDWQTADALLTLEPDDVQARITKEEATALHIAVRAQHTTFIEELLKFMRDRSVNLKLQTDSGFTALHYAAQSGIVRIAEQLVKFDDQLGLITDDNGDVPLNVAACLGRANMVSYLLDGIHLNQLTEKKRAALFGNTIYNELYDIALKILEMDEMIPHIYVESANTKCGWAVLEMLARKPFARRGSESQLSLWKSLSKYSWFKGIYNKALMKTSAHQLVERLLEIVGIPETLFSSNLSESTKMDEVIFEAAKVGNVELLIILLRSYPNLLWQLNKENMSIFHVAIQYRNESVFNLIYEIGSVKDSIASHCTSKTKENMLHLAAKLRLDRLKTISGPALQMQRELLWFKEIKTIVPPSYVNEKNEEGKTPQEIFIETHKTLQIEGEKWMKETANNCMLMATLIATVIFAAVFTVPGGSNQAGTPVFFERFWFIVFFISNATALCSSSTSIVFFLSILTSRYTEKDFLKSLPSKLVFGLVTLFISMVCMMAAFTATCFLVYSTKRAWAQFIVIGLASVPVILFALLHYKLSIDTLLSACTSRFLFGPEYRLFQRKMPIGESIRIHMKGYCRRLVGC